VKPLAKPSQKSWRRPLVFERRHEKLAPVSVFVKRIIGSLAMALGLIGVALMIGLAGYHYLAGFDWVDSLLEASMILGGMGPVNELPNDAAKIFASAYALFSGLMFIAVMGLVLSPIVHRILHKFHVDDKDVDKSS
jgi:TRAP-type C4-dicarboxylate transport system permease small subunit